MEAIIFIGIQASGKSTFYKEHFFKTHMRINLDMLKTRHRESIILNACIYTKQPFVIDNTNPTIDDRKRYIQISKPAGFKVIGYHFQSNIKESISRNELREKNEYVNLKGIQNTYKKLQLPSLIEGFDCLYYVKISKDNRFIVEEWENEI